VIGSAGRGDATEDKNKKSPRNSPDHFAEELRYVSFRTRRSKKGPPRKFPKPTPQDPPPGGPLLLKPPQLPRGGGVLCI